jgi:hypothetical protein
MVWVATWCAAASAQALQRPDDPHCLPTCPCSTGTRPNRSPLIVCYPHQYNWLCWRGWPAAAVVYVCGGAMRRWVRQLGSRYCRPPPSPTAIEHLTWPAQISSHVAPQFQTAGLLGGKAGACRCCRHRRVHRPVLFPASQQGNRVPSVVQSEPCTKAWRPGRCVGCWLWVWYHLGPGHCKGPLCCHYPCLRLPPRCP